MPAKLSGLPVNDLAVVLKVKRNTLHIEGNHKILPADASIAQTWRASVCFPLIDSWRQL